MRRAVGLPALCLLLHLHAAGCSSGNNNHFLAIHQRKSWKPVFIHHRLQDIEKSLDIAPPKMYKHSYHAYSDVQISKHHKIVNSAFPRPAYEPSVNLLAMAGQDLEVENLPIPASNVIVVKLLVLYNENICLEYGLNPRPSLTVEVNEEESWNNSTAKVKIKGNQEFGCRRYDFPASCSERNWDSTFLNNGHFPTCKCPQALEF